MTTLPLALAVAVASLLFGSCAVLLLWYRKGRLAADALQLLDRSELMPPGLPPAVLPFALPKTFSTVARVSGLTLAEAEDVLDWLEQNGYDERDLLCESGTTFAVEFHKDAEPLEPQPQAKPLRRYTAG